MGQSFALKLIRSRGSRISRFNLFELSRPEISAPLSQGTAK
jgi:hypothetical protein